MGIRFTMLPVCILFTIAQPLLGDEPRDVLKRAIKEHGGEEKLAKSATGKLTADATFATSPRSRGRSPGRGASSCPCGTSE